MILLAVVDLRIAVRFGLTTQWVQRLCHQKTKHGPVHDIPDQNSLILLIYRHIWKVWRLIEDGLALRCCDLIELTLVFDARDLNSVVQQTVRSGIWRNLRWRKLHILAKTVCDNWSSESLSLSFGRNLATNLIRHPARKKDFRHQEMDSLPLWSMQHASMTLNNPSKAEVISR